LGVFGPWLAFGSRNDVPEALEAGLERDHVSSKRVFMPTDEWASLEVDAHGGTPRSASGPRCYMRCDTSSHVWPTSHPKAAWPALMVGDTGIEPVTSSVSGTGNASAEVRPRASVQVSRRWARRRTSPD